MIRRRLRHFDKQRPVDFDKYTEYDNDDPRGYSAFEGTSIW